MQILSHLYPSLAICAVLMPVGIYIGMKRPLYYVVLSLFMAYTIAYPVYVYHLVYGSLVAWAFAVPTFIAYVITFLWCGLYLSLPDAVRARNRTYFFGTAGVSKDAVKRVRAEQRAEQTHKNVDPEKRGWIRVQK